MKLLLETRVDGRNIDQCRSTITVGQLMDLLSDYDNETEIYLSNDKGYTYGSIDITSFSEYENDEELEEEWEESAIEEFLENSEEASKIIRNNRIGSK